MSPYEDIMHEKCQIKLTESRYSVLHFNFNNVFILQQGTHQLGFLPHMFVSKICKRMSSQQPQMISQAQKMRKFDTKKFKPIRCQVLQIQTLSFMLPGSLLWVERERCGQQVYVKPSLSRLWLYRHGTNVQQKSYRRDI